MEYVNPIAWIAVLTGLIWVLWKIGMSRWPVAVVVLGLVGVVFGIYAVVKASEMNTIQTRASGWQVTEIDDWYVGYDDGLYMEFKSDAVIVQACGAHWSAPMQVGLWPGHLTIGTFTADRKDAECSGPSQDVAERTFEALSTVSLWERDLLGELDEYFNLELRGDHFLRLEDD